MTNPPESDVEPDTEPDFEVDFDTVDALITWAGGPHARHFQREFTAPVGEGVIVGINPRGRLVDGDYVGYGPVARAFTAGHRHPVEHDEFLDLDDADALRSTITALVEQVRVHQGAAAPEVMARLGEAAERVAAIRAALADAESARDLLIHEAVDSGMPVPAVAVRARVSRPRVYQIAPASNRPPLGGAAPVE